MENFYSLFVRAAEQWPQNVAVEIQRADRVEGYTFAELRQRAEAVGKWLDEQPQLPRGARCALLAANSPTWVVAYLGAMASGRVAVPLDTAFKYSQVATLLKDSGTQVLFVDQHNLPTAQKAIEGLAVQLVLLEPAIGTELPLLEQICARGNAGFVPAELKGDDLAVLLYTSGTTSDPKGVMLTHRNLVSESQSVFSFITLGPTDAILGVLPLFHALAQMANLLLPFIAGTRVVYLEQLNTQELLRGLRERDITLFCCVPQFFYLIHERVMKEVQARGPAARMAFKVMMGISRTTRPLGINLGKVFFGRVHKMLGPKMRYLVTGGSRFDTQIGRDLHDLGFNILQAYGLTETTGGAFATPPKDNVIGSVGQPLPGVEAKIVDEQAADDPEQPASGEVAIRGGIIMAGYYNRPDATAEVLKDGWLHTGDLGYFDDEGNLFITGRKKDVIVLSSGKNIYPEEIEAHYAKSPYVKEICVMGLPNRPGEPLGERLHAVVVPNMDLLKERKIVNTREIVRWDIEGLSAELAAAKRNLSFDIWQEDLPRTTTRKLKRFAIQKQVLAGQNAPKAAEASGLSEEDSGWLADPAVARAMEVVRRASKKGAPVSPGDNLELDLGLDSMERVELLVALEQALESHVDDAVVAQVYTVRELVDAIRDGMGKESERRGFAGWDAMLATESDDPDVHAIMKRRPLSGRLWFLFGRFVNLFARDMFKLRVTGLEKLPLSGAFILSPNHQSFLDSPILVATLPWAIFKKLFYVGTSEIFAQGIGKLAARTLKLIPVDPDANLVNAMRAGAFGLRRGRVLVLFPEGERSIDGTPKVFKKGAAILSAHLKVPIYPVALHGFYEAWPRGRNFERFSTLRIAIGDAIYPPEKVENPEALYSEMTAELRRRVVEMYKQLHADAGSLDRKDRAKALSAAAD